MSPTCQSCARWTPEPPNHWRGECSLDLPSWIDQQLSGTHFPDHYTKPTHTCSFHVARLARRSPLLGFITYDQPESAGWLADDGGVSAAHLAPGTYSARAVLLASGVVVPYFLTITEQSATIAVPDGSGAATTYQVAVTLRAETPPA